MKQTILALVVLSALPCSAIAEETPPPHAEDQPKRNYASAQAGVAISTSGAASGSSNFTFGARAGAGLFADQSGIFSLGVVIQTLSNSEKVSGVTVDGRMTPIMAELITRRVFGSGLYLGGRVGISFNSVGLTTSTTEIGASTVAFAVGPAIGYEFQITPAVGLVFDAAWTAVGGSTFTFPTGAKVEVESSHALSFQGGLIFPF